MTCIKITVSGRVQGVYFRAHTRKQAIKLNLTGYAKNLPDGRVEIIACGEQASIDQLLRWSHKGPLMARVDSVESTVLSSHAIYTDFNIL